MEPRDWFYLAGLILQGFGVSYVYGKLTGKVAEHDGKHEAAGIKFGALDAEQGRQWEQIGKHGERISSVEAKVQSLELRRHHD